MPSVVLVRRCRATRTMLETAGREQDLLCAAAARATAATRTHGRAGMLSRAPTDDMRPTADDMATNRRPPKQRSGVSPARPAAPAPRAREAPDGVYAQLREAIIRGRLRPGDRLVEIDVARQFRISRSSSREALKLLEFEGLVDAVPRHGYMISPITLRQVEDMFDLRLIVEPEAARRAAGRGSIPGVAALSRVVGEPYVPDHPGSYDGFLAQNRVFHLAIARLSGNEQVTALINSLLEQLERVFYLGVDIRDRAEDFMRQRREFVAAIQSADPDKAASVARSQIENSRQMVVDAILHGALYTSISRKDP